jgi:hypothetical protein
MAMNGLFMHILKYPQLSKAESDVSVLEIGAGHFRWIEFATELDIRWSFIKEMGQWARKALQGHTLPVLEHNVRSHPALLLVHAASNRTS